MSVSLLTARSLTTMVNTIQPVKKFILGLVFGFHKQHYTENVDIPIQKRTRKLAKTSRRTSPGGVVVAGDAEVKTLKLPHFREKMLSTAAAALSSTQPNGLYPDKSQMDALKMQLTENLATLRDRMEVVMEFMACQALRGAISVTGKDISWSVDYGFDSTHLPTKSGTAKWDSSAPNIPKDIRAWKKVVLKDCGQSPTIGILGTSAADAFVTDEKVMKALNNLNYKAGVLNLDSADANYLGRFMNIDWYEYAQEYVDDNGDAQQMYSEDDVTLFAPGNDFVLNFAPVADVKGGLNPVEFFSKTWDEEDPSGQWVLVETNPLPSVNNPNRILTATVTGS